MFKQFEKAEVKLDFGHLEMPWDEETTLNEQNITYFLQFLEELISTLIIIKAAKKGKPNAALASVNLSDINAKTFKKRPFKVKMPNKTNEQYESEYADMHRSCEKT